MFFRWCEAHERRYHVALPYLRVVAESRRSFTGNSAEGESCGVCWWGASPMLLPLPGLSSCSIASCFFSLSVKRLICARCSEPTPKSSNADIVMNLTVSLTGSQSARSRQCHLDAVKTSRSVRRPCQEGNRNRDLQDMSRVPTRSSPTYETGGLLVNSMRAPHSAGGWQEASGGAGVPH
jgi:hypothetical protein